MAIVVVVNKPVTEVTVTMAVVIAPRPIQVRQNSTVHVMHSKGISLIALTTTKLTAMPPH